MKHFFVITNRAKDPDMRLSHELANYIEVRGGTCAIRKSPAVIEERHRRTDPSEIPADTECIIVLGGDGTLMRAAVDVVGRQIPLLGINLGTLGYLAEIDRNRIYPALDALLAEQYTLQRRMLLKGQVVHAGQAVRTDIALNDIVISREQDLHVITLYDYVNDSYLNTYRADGVIISSPTGSTGYSLSAGGPLIAPSAQLFLLTPLAAHTLNSRSIVLPHESKITVRIGPGRDDTVEHAMAYFDGDRKVPMETGDSIDIVRAAEDVTFVRIHNDSFLETLRRKMTNL